MMKMNKSQNMNEMMSKMSESKRMMMEKMMGMCMCHDCSTLKDCSMNMDCSTTPSMTSSSMTSCMDLRYDFQEGPILQHGREHDAFVLPASEDELYVQHLSSNRRHGHEDDLPLHVQ